MGIRLPNTDRNYYIYTNAHVISAKLKKLGYENTVIRPQKGLSQADKDSIINRASIYAW